MTIDKSLLQSIPEKVGVYLLKDEANDVLYIGKAKSIRRRIYDHFLSREEAPREKLIREKTVNVDFLVTETEAEALILENNLIKQYSPPYNIQFKDDKSYPSLKVTIGADYPAMQVTRELLEDGSSYFGPYSSAWGIRTVARYAQRLFGVRNCKEIISPEKLRKPCLNYQIGICSAPCAKKIDKNEYRKSVNQLCMFLEGKICELEVELESEMKRLAEILDFEKAALVRDRLNAIKKVSQRQRVSKIIAGNIDVVGAMMRGDKACIQLFFVRDGNLVRGDQFVVNVLGYKSPSEILTTFIEQKYFGRKDIPSIILVSHKLTETSFIKDWFRKKGIRSKITTPSSDLESGLITLALKNTEEKLLLESKVGEGISKALIKLQELLELDGLPMRIEGIDVSTISGEDAVGALVTFFRGKAEKKGYRRYRIKMVKGIDDYSMIQEVVRRRYKRLIREGRKQPDLLLIDGGVGHLQAAVEELALFDIDLPVISIAKKKEQIYVLGERNPITLEEHSEALRLIKNVRDEAHRFAINYHKKLRVKKVKKSLLDEIPGIGKVKRTNLIKRFNSIEKLRKASVEEIAETPLVGQTSAKKIREFLK